MKVGDISEPFIMTNAKQKDVVAVVKLKSRVNGHRATMAEDYQALRLYKYYSPCTAHSWKLSYHGSRVALYQDGAYRRV
jgi:hypothetical protein